MRITSILLALLLAGTVASASEIDNAAAAMAGMEAAFTQRFTPKGFRNSQVESGTVIFGALPNMRWTYSRPEEKLFVFDGSHSWFYVPADKQVTVATVDDERKSELPFLLLGDPAARERLFDVRESTVNGRDVVHLQPRSGSAAIRDVTVTIAPATHLIEELEYADREGNRTVFDFSGFHKHAAPPELFHFNPPAGVDVVSTQ